MRNYDENTQPVQSFSPPGNTWDGGAATAEMRSGVSHEAASAEPPDTPEPWKIEQEIEHQPQWKKDASERENVPKPEYIKKGPIGERVKRVGAQDII